MKEKLLATSRKKLKLERLMTIGTRSIKVLPLEKDKPLTSEIQEEEEGEVEASKLTQWVLTYIEGSCQTSIAKTVLFIDNPLFVEINLFRFF